MHISYTMRAPLAIGPRLMPALIVAAGTDTYGTISVAVTAIGPAGAHLRYFVDTPGGTYENDADNTIVIRPVEFQPGDQEVECGDIARRALVIMLVYLIDDGLAYVSGDGATPTHGWSFDEASARWAASNLAELEALHLELTPSNVDRL